MILAEVPQVPHGHVPALTIVYLVAFVGFAAASALLFTMMRNASRAYQQHSTVTLALATLMTGLLAATGLILFIDAIGFIGHAIVGLALASALVLIAGARSRTPRSYRS